MAEKRVAGIPQMGFGTWKRNGDEAYNCVLWAIEAGYRHIDTAQGYKNEEEVGRAIRDSGLQRSELHITTKVAPENFGPGQVIASTKQSLEKLGVDQVDLLLLHWPSPNNEYPMADYMAEFAQVHDAGMTKTIGVSNFTIPLLDEAMGLLGSRPIATNQCEIHVYMQNRPIVDYCRSLGITMTAYSPLARGAIVGDPLLAEIGAAHGATGEQIALAFLINEGHVVIPSSSKKERIISNFAASEIELSDEELAKLKTLDRGMRLINGPWSPVWDE